MADFNYTGGVRFAPDKVVDVTADKDGNPTKACNPITGVCLEGGGDSDFSTAEVTVVTAEGAVIAPITAPNPLGDNDCSKAVFMNEAATYPVILYKGNLFVALEEPESYYIEKVSGDIEIIDVEGLTGIAAVITGDCSINIKNRQS